jgi:hypothetical protein
LLKKMQDSLIKLDYIIHKVKKENIHNGLKLYSDDEIIIDFADSVAGHTLYKTSKSIKTNAETLKQ